MVGDASQWLTQVCFPGITWCQFKEIFVQRFSNLETSASSVMNWLNSRPKEGETIASFGSRLVNALEAQWKQLSVEKIVVSVALAHMSRIDKRLQRLACTTEINNRAELLHELKAFSYVQVDNTEMPPSKKMKLTSYIKCHYCGKEGHKVAECRMRKEQQREDRRRPMPATPFTKEKRPLTCFKCGTAGHIAPMCPKATSNVIQEKRVDMCELTTPVGSLNHSVESFKYYFDSGAECSLIKEAISEKFSGSRFNNLVALKGIGDAIICIQYFASSYNSYYK